jgi:hypothetical protein
MLAAIANVTGDAQIAKAVAQARFLFIRGCLSGGQDLKLGWSDTNICHPAAGSDSTYAALTVADREMDLGFTASPATQSNIALG